MRVWQQGGACGSRERRVRRFRIRGGYGWRLGVFPAFWFCPAADTVVGRL